jgi:DNA (cytosine-5)-methyltransferase 1
MSLKALDLFCGMGGLSWGIQSTGLINPVWAVDKHPPALELYQRNFPSTHVLPLDLSKASDVNQLLEKISFYGDDVDIVVGGSPCRGFTQIRNGQNTQSDPHNRLAMKFADIVRELNPLLFIYENVPQLESFPVFPKFLSRLRGRECYRVSHVIVEAANFGTPSRRTRLFVVGFRADLGQTPDISLGLNISYQQFWWQRNLNDDKITYSPRLSEPWKSILLDYSDLRLVNVEQAISDLPLLQPGASADKLAYTTPAQSAYQRWARQGIYKADGHAVPLIRPETQARLKAIPPGGNWRDLPEPLTYKIPYDLSSGSLKRRHYSAYRRLLPEGHSPTVQGHADFAYHYRYERALTPRELARLMGFPDKFQLGQGHDAVVKAIGNAVPPRMVTGITTGLVRQLGIIK